MAYRKPQDLDGYIQIMPKADMRVKTALAEDLVTFLSDESNSTVCVDMGLLVDNLIPWLTGSHFKIAQKSLEAFSELIKRLGPDFNAYTATVLPHVTDRLGDSKDTVREKAQLLLQNFMEYKVLSPQSTIDKMAASCFKHKNAKVREEFLQTIVNTLNEYGTSQLSVRNYIHPISSLLGDPTSTVRDAAIQTLIEIYKHVGDRLRADLRKMEDVPSSKLAILEQKFDQVKSEGLLLKSASITTTNNNGQDESDNASMRERPTRIVKRVASANPRIKSNSTDLVSLSDAGAITVDNFESSFEAVPQLAIFHPKDKEDVYKSVVLIISDKNADWEKKVDSLKRIRSLLLLNIQSQPQFALQLKDLSIYFLDILKEELRSQVIREACITIAYMSKVLGNKLDQFCIYILEQLINLIQNSARVIASSSTIAVKYIVRYTHAPKLIKIITDTLQTSKSKDIRANLSEILCLLLADWQTKSLERYSIQIKNTLKKSISDADNDARRHSRRAYWMFRKHFPDLADQIYVTIDITTQKALERERDGSNGSDETRSVAASMRFQRSAYALQKPVGIRSVSAVDAAAAQRAKARSQYTLGAKKKPNSSLCTPATNASCLPRSKPLESTLIPSQISQSTSRIRGRSGVSQSQPSSRSTSPSSKLRDQQNYYRPLTGTVPKKASAIPRSLASSRETSPTRNSMKRSIYATGVSNIRRSSERNTQGRPLATARLLQQSRDAENSLSDVLSPDGIDKSDYSLNDYSRVRLGRRLLSRDESDDSEASSVCSERSNDSSFTRGNIANYSLSGSRNRLDWSNTRVTYNFDLIIQYCASAHWSERKDGLTSLTQYLADGKSLTSEQLQSVLDMFRKMFMDTHAKVYSLFLDAVTELILAHANDLHDWLFVLLTRLFNKLGTELLNSMHSKIWKTLQVVHEYFPIDLQLKDILRILCDTAQTPCTKTKIAMLKFLTNLATTYCKNTDFPIKDGMLSLEKALLKIVQLSGDHKSTELRGQARLCLIALYNCNTPLLIRLLSNLPKGYQDSAKTIIKSHLCRNSTSGTNSPSSSPLSSSSPKPLQSPSLAAYTSMQPQLNTSLPGQSSVEEEFYIEGDVQHNIHKTSEEIRNCFGTDATLSRQYHSLSIAANGHNGHMNDQHDSCTSSNSKTQSNTTTESNTPENNTKCFEVISLEQYPNDFHKANHKSMSVDSPASTMTTSTHHTSLKQFIKYNVAANGEIELESGLRESEIIKQACALTTSLPAEEISETLFKLGVCIKGGNCELPNKNFRAIMKMLLSLLSAQSPEIVVDALYILSKIVRSEKMKPNWDKFLELILLKIIDCYQISKETVREVDAIIPRIVPVLPLDATINIVNPVIATGAYPLNLCAVKLLTELIGRQSADFTETHLDNVFPNLARLTDNAQSMVRKAAVFCIVKLYMIMGEDKIKPKLSLLNPSKVRLLNVYIEKQRNSPSSGSLIKISSVS